MENSVTGVKEPLTIQRLKELSKMICVKCNAQAPEICFNCRIHELINQLLNEITS